LFQIECWSEGSDGRFRGGELNAIHIGPLKKEASRKIPLRTRSHARGVSLGVQSRHDWKTSRFKTAMVKSQRQRQRMLEKLLAGEDLVTH
jgi:hypothetical protein